jgi:hypothetical protein
VTKENIKKIIDYKKNQDDENKQIIFKFVKDLGKCYPKDIKKILDIAAKKIAEEEYEKGLDKNEKVKIFKKYTMRRETIQRKLKVMLKEGSIVKVDGKYSLSELALSDLRYFSPDSGRQFGNTLLNALLQLHYPTINDFKTNIDELIDIFGFYLLYTLIESCRPIKIQNKDKYIENRTKDVLTEKWFEKAINHETLLNSFISTVTNQYNDEQREEYFKKHHKLIDENTGYYDYIEVKDPDKNEIEKKEAKHILDPMSAADFSLRRFYYISSKEGNIKYRTNSNPLYELNQKIIDDINNILKEKYPNYYSQALLIRSGYLGRPKEGSLKDRRDKFRYINFETEETEHGLD